MPPKKKAPKPYPWAKGNGKLEPFMEGVLFGMHLQGCPPTDIAALLDVHRNTVYLVVKTVNARLGVT